MSKRALSVLLISGVVVVAFYAGCVRPAVSKAHQVKTTANMQGLLKYLENYRSAHSTYPMRLSAALTEDLSPADRLAFLNDAWGHPIHYESRGTSFILVSFGADQTPDGLDYWAIRSAFGNAAYELGACRDPRSDIIASDIGFQRACGK